MKLQNIKLCAVLLMLLVLCAGCSQKQYEILETDGKYYIHFLQGEKIGEIDSPDLGVVWQVLGDDLCFTSLAEMKQKILAADITAQQVVRLRQYTNDGTQPFLDMNNLYDLEIPDGELLLGVELAEEISGTCYRFIFGNAENQFSLSVVSKEQYDRRLPDCKEQPKYPYIYDILCTEILSDQNAKKVHYREKRTADEYMEITYEISKQGWIMYVREYYELSHETAQDLSSKGIPETVWICCEDEGRYFTSTLRNLKERPSVEWLSQLGLRKFEG